MKGYRYGGQKTVKTSRSTLKIQIYYAKETPEGLWDGVYYLFEKWGFFKIPRCKAKTFGSEYRV